MAQDGIEMIRYFGRDDGLGRRSNQQIQERLGLGVRGVARRVDGRPKMDL